MSTYSFEDTIFSHRDEISTSRFSYHFLDSRPCSDEVSESLVESDDFIDSDSSLETTMITLITSSSLVEFHIFCSDIFHPCSIKHILDDSYLLRIFFFFYFTGFTYTSDESLCDNSVYSRGNQERLQSHTDQSIKSLCSTFSMQSREDEMSRERGICSRHQRLEITYFSDHDDIWILSEKSFESCFKGESIFFVYF